MDKYSVLILYLIIDTYLKTFEIIGILPKILKYIIKFDIKL